MKRTIIKDALTHCYQRSADKGVIFYTISDHLLYFTILCVIAPRYGVRILKVVEMPDHLHHGAIEERRGALSALLRDVNSVFAREFNRGTGHRGPVLEHSFGSAAKTDGKKCRTLLVYLDNNPVERHLVKKAEEYQWNFLAYAISDHPFSDKIVLRKASMPLRRALSYVKAQHKSGHYLTIPALKRLFGSLPDDRERDQLTDYIVVTYSVIDYQAAMAFFGSYEEELIAAHATSGSEYDLKEHFVGRTDLVFNQMSAILRGRGLVKDIHEVFTLSEERKWELYQMLQRETDARPQQIAAFLHLARVEISI